MNQPRSAEDNLSASSRAEGVAIQPRTERTPEYMKPLETPSFGLSHNLRVLRAKWVLEFKALAKFRADFFIGTGVSLIWMFVAIAPVLVAGRYLGEGDGWTQARLLFLQAVWCWMDAALWVFISPGSEALRHHVRQGTLDGQLLMPGSSLTRIMLGHLGVQDTPKFLVCAALGGYAISQGALPGGAGAIICFVVAMLGATVIFWAAGGFAVAKAITMLEFSGEFAVSALLNLSRMPTSMYGSVLRVLFSSVFPVVLITTVPSQVFFGWSAWWLPAVPVAVGIALVLVLRLIWNREIKNYVGFQN
jgi:ABC-2 type transport system permease protein